MKNNRYIFILLIAIACQQTPKQPQNSGHSCTPTQSRFNSPVSTTSQEKFAVNVEEMVLIPGGTFSMGGDDDQAWRDEYPSMRSLLIPFGWMSMR